MIDYIHKKLQERIFNELDKILMTRTYVLNHLAEKYKLKRYLEIGVQNPTQNFDKINCEYKVCVDPDPKAHATFIETSDKFFSRGMNNELNFFNPFDLIFIDGLHTAEQVRKDFDNALRVISPNGFIVLHDCNPEKEEHTIVPRPTERGHWNGDVYKFAIGIDKAYAFTVDVDNGCLVFSNKESVNSTVYKPVNVGFDFFNVNRKTLLNLITWDEFVKL